MKEKNLKKFDILIKEYDERVVKQVGEDFEDAKSIVEDKINNEEIYLDLTTNYYKESGDLNKIGLYYWGEQYTNAWSTSQTNTINLNTNFLTYLNAKNIKWENMIELTIKLNNLLKIWLLLQFLVDLEDHSLKAL